ncbi:MAG: dNTP triphosphohydrolase, partial [Eubacteriaceae bacterium]|nr:dNTP triphosphohydrolase [Eubacteriaceae bacterium]
MPSIREKKETREQETLSPYALLSSQSKGRQHEEEACPVRTCFERDRDRIIHSKSFRRLMHKTQVFIAPESDHYRTRLTHTLEVSQIARSIASALRLNEALAEAIALGHDLGHTPFGHIGEEALNEACPFAFEHNLQSLRIVEKLEGGSGLNLCWEVRDGIKNHCTGYDPSTLEGK